MIFNAERKIILSLYSVTEARRGASRVSQFESE